MPAECAPQNSGHQKISGRKKKDHKVVQITMFWTNKLVGALTGRRLGRLMGRRLGRLMGDLGVNLTVVPRRVFTARRYQHDR